MNKGYRIYKYFFLLSICILVVSLLLTGCGEPTIEELIEDLYSQRSELRESAGEALVEIGTPAVEPLIAVFEGDDAVARELAADALGEIGDARAVEPFIAILESEDALNRRSVAEALGKIGDARAVEPLIAMSYSEDFIDREYAKDALINIGTPAIKALISSLKAEYRYGYAEHILKQIGLPAVEALIAALEDDWNTMTSAIRILVDIGTPAVEPLIAALDNKPFLIQLRVAWVLEDMPTSEAKEAAERFITPLRLLSAGRGVGEMAAYGGSSPHPILILDDSYYCYIDSDTYKLPSEWIPTSIDDIELVVLVGESEWVTIEECEYQGGRWVYRKQYQIEVGIIEAQTGSVIADKVFLGSLPHECNEWRIFYSGTENTIQGDRVPFEKIQQWLSIYVEGQ